MDQAFSRTVRLLGEERVKKLQESHVIVFGLGGVGSYAVEALVRGGIGALTLVDFDTIDVSNLNRQLQTTRQNIGRLKAEVTKERCQEIMPACRVEALPVKVDASNVQALCSPSYDFAIDAIDMVSSKLLLAETCQEKGLPLVASMGTGNKVAPERLQMADVFSTKVCPLARIMRKELRRRGVNKLPVVFSDEEPVDVGGSTPGSNSFVPATAGLLLASYVIRELLGV